MAEPIKFINADFVKVRSSKTSRKTAFYLYFGDPVVIEEVAGNWTKITAPHHITVQGNSRIGFVKTNNLPVRDDGILKMSMVDVQQGDGMVLETPNGKIVFIDGGDNKLFARHVAARFRYRKSSKDNPLPVDAIIVTHGDADHFDGLNDIRRSQSLSRSREHKRIFIHPKRVLHNGIVKRPTSVAEKNRLGTPIAGNNGHDYIAISELHEDIRVLDEAELNRPFKFWVTSLKKWEENSLQANTVMKRVDNSMPSNEVFDFLEEEGIRVEIHGPILEDFEDMQANPQKGFRVFSNAAHTINGHSIAFRLTYDNVRILFTGDLNKESMDLMHGHLGAADLEAEVLKTPHHGSADFDISFLKNVKPIVSLVSSGDENTAKDYIHPRATLMSALGKVSRLQDMGIIFSTELSAFFSYRSQCYTRTTLKDFFKNHSQYIFTKEELEDLFTGNAEGPREGEPRYFDGFQRSRFGLIELRTDGSRVLVFIHGGKDNIFESYAFTVTTDAGGNRTVQFADKTIQVG